MSKHTFKISLLGDKNVGKTSIVTAYTKDEFNFETLATIGIDTSIKKKTFDNVEYTFKIFDTVGQEKFNSISTTTIQMAVGFFMVFAINHRKSYERIVHWISYIEEYVNLKEKVIFIIGNKSDVKPEEREVTKEEAEVFAKSKNAKYFENSALNRNGINESFEEMFKDVYEMSKKNNNWNSNIILDKTNKKKKNVFVFKIVKYILFTFNFQFILL